VMAVLLAAVPWQLERQPYSFSEQLVIRLIALIVVVMIARHLSGMQVPVVAVALITGMSSQRN
jgi:hypothetical protein